VTLIVRLGTFQATWQGSGERVMNSETKRLSRSLPNAELAFRGYGVGNLRDGPEIRPALAAER